MSKTFVPDFMNTEKPTTKPSANEAVKDQKSTQDQAASPKEEKKEKKSRAKEMSPEHIQFVLSNVKNMSYTEMAEKTGLTKHQVNRILMDTKKNLRENTAEGSPEREKVEEYIKNNLSRPEDSRPGAGSRSSKVKETLNNTANDIMKQLGIG